MARLALAALLGAVVSPYVAEWIRERIFSARLEMSCEPGVPWSVATEDPLEEKPSPPDPGCEVVLEQIWFAHRDDWYEIAYWEPVNLLWAGDQAGNAQRTVNREREVFFDIGSVPAEAKLRELEQKGKLTQEWPGSRGGSPIRAGASDKVSRPAKRTRARRWRAQKDSNLRPPA